MKRLFTGVAALVVAVFLLSSTAFAATGSPYATSSTGVDVGYFNCSATLPTVVFGVVEVTDGLVYSTNSCAAAEASNFRNVSLYANTGLNASSSSSYYTAAEKGCHGSATCAAYHYGYNAGINAFDYAKSLGLSSATWWLDVETANTWNSDVTLNQQSLQGEHDALIASGVTNVGVYSSTSQWQSITGSWQNNWPSWGSTAWTSASQAQTYCTGHQFTGGASWLMQYKSSTSQVDQDVAC